MICYFVDCELLVVWGVFSAFSMTGVWVLIEFACVTFGVVLVFIEYDKLSIVWVDIVICEVAPLWVHGLVLVGYAGKTCTLECYLNLYPFCCPTCANFTLRIYEYVRLLRVFLVLGLILLWCLVDFCVHFLVICVGWFAVICIIDVLFTSVWKAKATAMWVSDRDFDYVMLYKLSNMDLMLYVIIAVCICALPSPGFVVCGGYCLLLLCTDIFPSVQ
eukprot:gene2902-1884_t